MNSENNNSNPEIRALKNQLFTLLVALIVVSGTLTVYLFRQASLTGHDLTQSKQLEKLVTQNEVSIKNFVDQLVAYAQKHPDFQPVLTKYGINPNATPTAPAPAPNK